MGILDSLFSSKKQWYFKSLYSAFKQVIVIYATGWERNFSCTSNSGLTIIRVPYSEHCSYDELQQFLKLIRPRAFESIISEKDTKECRNMLGLGHEDITKWNAAQKKINISCADVNE